MGINVSSPQQEGYNQPDYPQQALSSAPVHEASNAAFLYVKLSGADSLPVKIRKVYTLRFFYKLASAALGIKPEEILFVTDGHTGRQVEIDDFQKYKTYVCHTKETVPTEQQFISRTIQTGERQ